MEYKISRVDPFVDRIEVLKKRQEELEEREFTKKGFLDSLARRYCGTDR